jgi:hypothetical protein
MKLQMDLVLLLLPIMLKHVDKNWSVLWYTLRYA